MEYSSANSSDFWDLVNFFFFFNYKINGIFYLFSLQCTAVRLPAPGRVLKLLLLGQQWPFAIFLELSAAFDTIITFPLLKLFTLLFLKQCISLCQPSHLHRFLFLWLHLTFLLMSPGCVFSSHPSLHSTGTAQPLSLFLYSWQYSPDWGP